MRNPFGLEGKRALITGGSKGIGLGIAQGLAQAGAAVVLVARHEADLESARQSMEALGTETATFQFDIAHTRETEAFYQHVNETSGPMDILVNNAGINLRAPAHELSLDDWDAVIQVNLSAMFAFAQAFAKERMAANSGGVIINIASLMSEAARPTTAAYTASKGGVRQLTKALAVDWAPYGIRVNAIGPGYIQTPLTQPLQDDPEFNAWVLKRTPLGRWGVPEDLAHAAVFLASDGAAFITGQTMYVDGGWLATF